MMATPMNYRHHDWINRTWRPISNPAAASGSFTWCISWPSNYHADWDNFSRANRARGPSPATVSSLSGRLASCRRRLSGQMLLGVTASWNNTHTVCLQLSTASQNYDSTRGDSLEAASCKIDTTQDHNIFDFFAVPSEFTLNSTYG